MAPGASPNTLRYSKLIVPGKHGHIFLFSVIPWGPVPAPCGMARNLWTVPSGKAVCTNVLIVSSISWLFYLIMALPPWALVFNQVFLQWDVQKGPLVFLFVLLFNITTGPFQTIIFKGHLFCSICSRAWQWVNDTWTSHAKIMCCVIRTNHWVKGEKSKQALFQETNTEDIS